MAGEGDGLHGHALLHTAVARERDDVVVENGVRGGVVFRGGHFLGNGVADGVGDALTERAGGSLDAGGFVKLRMTRRVRAEDAELFHLLVHVVLDPLVAFDVHGFALGVRAMNGSHMHVHAL